MLRVALRARLSRDVVFMSLVALGLFAALFPSWSSGVSVREGEPAGQTVRSPRDLSYQSDVLTQRLRDEAAAAVAPSLVFDAAARSRQMLRLDDVLARVSAIRSAQSLDATQKSVALTSLPGVQLSPRAAVLALAFGDDEWDAVRRESRQALGQSLDGSIPPDGVTRAREALSQAVALRLPEGVTLLVREVAGALIAPNQVIDEAATERAREQARSAVAAPTLTLARGEIIVRAGEQVDALVTEKLRRLDLLNEGLLVRDVGAAALVAAVAAVSLTAFQSQTRSRRLAEGRYLALLAVVVIGAVAAARLALPHALPDDDRLYLAYMLPLAAAPLLLAAVLDFQLAAAAAALLAALVGYVAFEQPSASDLAETRPLDVVALVAVTLFGGLAGAFVGREADRIGRLLAAGTAIAATSVTLLLAFLLLDPAARWRDVAMIGVSGAVAGAGAALVAAAVIVPLGARFGFATRFRLVELARLDQPLLRRLREEAPGTFHHSVLISGLAGRAAEAMGADAALVQVGCYYHDIGKALQPRYFIENQGRSPNPHADLDPARSAAVIIDHVRNGVELARRGGLPAPVRAFISEHHGTRLVSYFYRKAAQDGAEPSPAEFRYPGRKPQTRETAIVMLADSVEAVVRSSLDRSLARIDALVDSVIAERLAEGELDECDLTLRDIAALAASFKATLHGVYHPRLEYPAPTSAEQARAAEAARLLEALLIPMDGGAVPVMDD